MHAAEAFLKLRTNLQFMDIDNPPRVIVVTSPLPGDGKSTVAANLAAALSMSDRRVVLIDGDLRRPVVAESFGLIEGAGLTDVLIGRVRLRRSGPAGGVAAATSRSWLRAAPRRTPASCSGPRPCAGCSTGWPTADTS